MTYIRTIFIPGARYRIKRNFKSGPVSMFVEGEVVTFERETYSFYDNAFVYLFRSEKTGAIKEWWLLEGRSADLWHIDFELVGDAD